MKKKDVEKIIISSLEDKSAELNPHVLDAAKSEMENSKSQKTYAPIWKFAVAFCVLIAVCLTIALPIALGRNNNAPFQELTYSSMRDYLENAKLPYKALSDVCSSEGGGCDANNPPPTGINQAYVPTECILIKFNGKDACIQETYLYGKNEVISCYLMIDNDKAVTDNLFGQWQEFDMQTSFYEIEVSYNYDANTKTGICKFLYASHEFYMSMESVSQSSFFIHIQSYLDLQKNSFVWTNQ